MGKIEKTYYECDGCKKQYDTDDGMVWVCEIGHIQKEITRLDGETLIFCNKECLKKWIDEVL